MRLGYTIARIRQMKNRVKICCSPLSGIGIPLHNPDGNLMESSPE